MCVTVYASFCVCGINILYVIVSRCEVMCEC